MQNFLENIKSGKGKGSKVPKAVAEKFNWGAFSLPLFWSLANKSYKPLWILLFWYIPIVNLVFSYYCGTQGNEWAWQNKEWENIQTFHNKQRLWAKWGAIYMLTVIALAIVLTMGANGTFEKMANEENERLDKIYCDQALSSVGKILTTFTVSGVDYTGAVSNVDQLAKVFVDHGRMKRLSKNSVISKDGITYVFIAPRGACDIMRKNCGVTLERTANTFNKDTLGVIPGKEKRTFCVMYIGQTETSERREKTKVVKLK